MKRIIKLKPIWKQNFFVDKNYKQHQKSETGEKEVFKIMFKDGEWTEKWTWNWYTQSLASSLFFLHNSEENSLWFFLFVSYSSLALAYESCYVNEEFHYTLNRQEEERRLNSICHHSEFAAFSVETRTKLENWLDDLWPRP